MKLTMTSYITLLILAIFVVLSGSCLSMYVQTVNAREYHSANVDRIQASNFSDLIILEIEETALDDGYVVTIDDCTLYEDREQYLVTTTYEISFPLFGIVQTGTLESYAR